MANDLREVVAKTRVAEGMHADADPARAVRLDVASEQLDDAQLARLLGGALEADQPERGERARVQARHEAHLDEPVVRQPEGALRLSGAHDQALTKGMLARA